MNSKYSKYEPIFGVWYITKLLGRGSFGEVYEITREELGVTYKAALKVISVPQDEDDVKVRMTAGTDVDTISEYYEEILKEIVRENEIMSRLKGNSNIVSYEDHRIIPHEDGIGYDILIRMELLTPLIDRMLERNLTEPEVVKLGIDICKALELCQKRNIIHRDIKPQNLFVSEDGDFKLGDFGIARTIEKTTGGMSRKGTYNYMAPEVFRGDEYDGRADIYSLGMVMYTLLNGNRGPFFPDSSEKITLRGEEEARLRRFRGEKLPAPKDASPLLAHIILKACAAEPKDRYEDASQFKTDLELYFDNHCAAEVGKEYKTSEAPTEMDLGSYAGAREIVKKPGVTKRPLWLALGLGILAAVIGIAAIYTINNKKANMESDAVLLPGTEYEMRLKMAEDKTGDYLSENENLLKSYNDYRIEDRLSSEKEDKEGYPIEGKSSSIVKYGVGDFTGDGLIDFFEYEFFVSGDVNRGQMMLVAPKDPDGKESEYYFLNGRNSSEFDENYFMFLNNGIFIESWKVEETNYCRIYLLKGTEDGEDVYIGDKDTAIKYFSHGVCSLLYIYDDPEKITRVELGTTGDAKSPERIINMEEFAAELRDLTADGEVIIPYMKDYAEARKEYAKAHAADEPSEDETEPETESEAEAKSTFKAGKQYVTQTELRIREGASTEARIKKKTEVTTGNSKALQPGKNAVLKKGVTVTCLETDGDWIKTEYGWICGREGNDIYLK